ncbi:MAG: glutamate--tRNA ligase [Buchnera aphidicola (Kaburagia rhusicola ensigallis)]
MLVTTRFAPSPTGCLHIGGVRTALYAWLFAKSKQGKFILRIEDTDFKRFKKDSILEITNNLKWLGLYWDEGPYFQSNKIEYYKDIVNSMIRLGLAYKCYCTSDRLISLRKNQLLIGKKPKYDRKCRNLINNSKNNANYVVRFRNPIHGKVSFIDVIRGNILFDNNELDDVIIQRTNGVPTYNFCSVIDDRDTNITHVIRGEDHINNTPRQINILKALGARIPIYAHTSMILDVNGKKLSKRNEVVSISEYRLQGYLPEALLNYIVRLGWSHGNQEIFNVNDMIKLFTLSGINKSPSRVDVNKLLWLNRFYIKNLPGNAIEKHLQYQFKRKNINYLNGPNLITLIKLVGSRYNTLQDMVTFSHYFYKDYVIFNIDAAKKYLVKTSIVILDHIYKKISNLKTWSLKELSTIMNSSVLELKMTSKMVSMPIRVAITGDTISPSVHVIIYGVGKLRSLLRIKAALSYIRNN